MNDDIIDYALPSMRAESALKRVHEAALMKNYTEARVQAHLAMLQCSQLFAALLIMQLKDQENGTTLN